MPPSVPIPPHLSHHHPKKELPLYVSSLPFWLRRRHARLRTARAAVHTSTQHTKEHQPLPIVGDVYGRPLIL
jgi:hypothetical protein